MSQKNTVLLIEPRKLPKTEVVLSEFQSKLGFEKWHYVFYCGRESISYWRDLVHPQTELRELAVDNFPKACIYSNFMKQKWLWESLHGEFVLTIQADTWPINREPYTIEHFMAMNKSYIGGAMNEHNAWPQLKRENWYLQHLNFNGGLSLRKRLDMIRVIENFPPIPTSETDQNLILEADAEDVYFLIGCHRLGLSVSDDAETVPFAVHLLFMEYAFGIHQPDPSIWPYVQDRFKEAVEKNPYLNPHTKVTVWKS